MICLKLVKTSTEEEANSTYEYDDGVLHGTNVLLELVRPWENTNILVCNDFYFASVGAELSLMNIGLRFIGVVKTTTKKFPMKYLSEIKIQSRGERSGLVMNGNEGELSLLAFV